MHGQLAAQLEQQKAADTARQAQLERLFAARGEVPPGVAGGPGGGGEGDWGSAAGEDVMS